ncbi:spermatid-specific linker histone H1-like protein [Zootoca vivipara]|uniref:spermatid-specific linker histone H1-like protein n=1 Tax=Zootoca vivipara TaxID=8524 RepID=UPI00159215D2|nr:spermatid-specific linker histone H1-like protein [Zootoca vivipara]
MSTLGKIQLNNDERSDEGNSEETSSDLQQENQGFREPQPSCSGEHLKPASRSRSKRKEAHKLSYPGKSHFPKHGLSKLILEMLASHDQCSTASLQSLKERVAALRCDLEKQKRLFKRAERTLVAKGLLRKLTGCGLTSSCAINQMLVKVLKRRRRRRKRRERERKKKAKRNRRNWRKRRRKKTPEPPDLQNPVLMTGAFHS